MAVSMALTFVGGLCFLPVTGVACSRWGTLAGHALITLEDADYALGETLVTLGGTPAHAGHAEGRWLRSEGDAGHARGNAGVLLRSSGSLLGCWCTPRTSLFVSVVEVKYASRCPPYIAESELLSRISWCESQHLIGSS